MASVAFAFGSFGDIVTVIQILNEIRQTLSDGQGAYTEYQDAVEELDHYVFQLQHLDLVRVKIGSCGVSDPTTGLIDVVDETALQRVGQALTASKDVAIQLQHILKRYELSSVSSNEGIRTWMYNAARKIRWTLSSARKSVDSKRGELSRRILAVSTFLVTIQTSIHSQEAMRLNRGIQEVLNRLPRSPIIELLTLVDILDRRIPIAMYHCEFQKDFHEYLLFLFRNSAGNTFVRRGEYILTNDDTEDAYMWQALARPGATLTMAAIVRVPISKLEKGYCPKCRKINESTGAVGSLRIVKCRYCNTDLVDGSWSGVSAFDAANEFAFTNDEQTSVPSTYFQRPNEDEETDVSLARRLSVRAIYARPHGPTFWQRQSANFLCPVPGCGSTFTRHFNLKKHLRAHAADRPYPCKWPGCGMGFEQQHDFKQHEERHLHIRPYFCEGCKTNFSSMDALNRHQLSEASEDCSKVQAEVELSSHMDIISTDHMMKPEPDDNWNESGDHYPVPPPTPTPLPYI